MPLGSRSSLGAVAGVAVALALPVAAMACTPDEYLTAEERASGLYDTTPPDYYAGSDAPHTHGDVAAPAPAEAAPQTKGGGEPQAVTPATTRERDERRAPAGEGESPAPVVTPVVTPVVSETATIAPAPETAAPAVVIDHAAIARARARERAARTEAVAQARAARAAARQKARTVLRAQRPPVRPTASRSAAVAAGPRRAEVSPDTAWPWLLLTAGAAALLAAVGVLMGRRHRLAPVHAPLGVDPIEAELQAMLAEEHALRTARDDTPVEPDRSRI